MNFVKRAMFSMKMRFLKNIGYTLIFSALSVMIFGGLLIYQAAGEKTEAYKENLAAAVTLQEKPVVTEEGTITNTIPDQLTDKFLSDSRIKKYNKIITTFGQALNFTPLYTVDNATYQAMREEALASGIYIDLIFYGMTDSASFDAFTGNGCSLVEGRHIVESDDGTHVAIIEQGLAEKNGLHVGDTLEVANFWSPDFPDYYQYPPLEIIGIYAYPENADYDTSDYASTQPGNFFFTDFETSTLATRYSDPDWPGYVGSARVYLADPADVPKFIADTEGWLDMEKYELSSDGEWYKYAAGAIEQLGAVTKTVVGIAVLVGFAVFLLVGGVSLLGRKRELGILMSMGERKAKICGQLLIESVVPVLLAIVVGLCAGEPAARMISQSMLDDVAGSMQDGLETYKKESDPDDPFRMADAMSSHDADGLQIDTALSLQPTAKTQALFFACMLGFALLSVLVQTVYVVRVQPVKLLIKRE